MRLRSFKLKRSWKRGRRRIHTSKDSWDRGVDGGVDLLYDGLQGLEIIEESLDFGLGVADNSACDDGDDDGGRMLNGFNDVTEV